MTGPLDWMGGALGNIMSIAMAALVAVGPSTCAPDGPGTGVPEEPPASDSAPATPSPPVRPSQVWGYVSEIGRAAAWSSVQAHRNTLTGVALFQYHLDSDGDLIEYAGAGGVPASVVSNGTRIVPMITNEFEGRWERDVVVRVLRDATRRRYHIQQLVRLAVSGGYPGIEIDYENLSAADRDLFSQFIEELAGALHERGKQLAVAVHAKLAEPGEWDGPRAQDWARIGAAADRVIVMTYDYDPSRPGPIAPLQWTSDVLRFAISVIPPTKVIQGVPLYGYDWSRRATPADLTYRDAMDLARRRNASPRRDEISRHASFAYTEGGIQHEVWLVDGETVAALVAIGREVGVAGYAVWRLGGEDESAWEPLRAAVR